MNLPRRRFLALLPPMPVGFKEVLRAPKDADRTTVMRKAVKPYASLRLVAVVGTDLDVTGITIDGGQVTVTWIGARPCFSVQQAHDINGPWVQIGKPTAASSKTFPASDRGFIRIMDNVTMPLTATLVNGLPHLEWDAPDI